MRKRWSIHQWVLFSLMGLVVSTGIMCAQGSLDFEGNEYIAGERLSNVTDLQVHENWAVISSNGKISENLEVTTSDTHPAEGAKHARLIDNDPMKNISAKIDLSSELQEVKGSFLVAFAVAPAFKTGANGAGVVLLGDGLSFLQTKGNYWVYLAINGPDDVKTPRTVAVQYRKSVGGENSAFLAKDENGTYLHYMDGQYLKFVFTINAGSQQITSLLVNGVEQIGLGKNPPGLYAFAKDRPAGIFQFYTISPATGTLDVDAVQIKGEGVVVKREPVPVALTIGTSSTPFRPLVLGQNMEGVDWFGREGKFESVFYDTATHELRADWKPYFTAFPMQALRLHWGSNFPWKDMVGPIEDRKIVPHDLYKTVAYRPDAGLDEFLRMCESLPYPPRVSLIASPLRPPQELADLVAYCNATTGPMAEWRERNGHPKPYNVMDWELGNEIDFHFRRDLDIMRADTPEEKARQCSVERYIVLVKPCLSAMRAVDPRIRLFVHAKTAPWFNSDPDWPKWHQTLLTKMGTQIDGIVIHPYYDGYSVPTALKSIDQLIEDIHALSPPGRKISVWVNEHARWVEPNQREEWPQSSGLQGAISTGDFLIELLRRPEISAANYWNLGARNPWGLLGIDSTAVSLEGKEVKFATGIHALYRLFNEAQMPEMISVSVDHGSFTRHPPRYAYSVNAVLFADKARGRYALLVINRNATTDFVSEIQLPVGKIISARLLTISGPSLRATNTPKQPDLVRLVEEKIANPLTATGKGQIRIPARSVCVWIWEGNAG